MPTLARKSLSVNGSSQCGTFCWVVGSTQYGIVVGSTVIGREEIRISNGRRRDDRGPKRAKTSAKVRLK